jgi:cytoskeleton protein RodZ
VLQDRRSEFTQGKALMVVAEDLPEQAAAERQRLAQPFSIGNDLRVARERLGWDPGTIAAHLRIRPSILSAIEEGRFADMPAGAYMIGFLRTYARALGLDADEAARRFRAEAAELTRKPELIFPAPMAERGVPVGVVVLLGAVLAIGAYVGWYRLSSSRPGEEPVREVPQRLADMVQPPPAPLPKPAEAPSVVAEVPQPVMPPSVPPSSAAAAIPAAGVFGPPLATTPVSPGAGLPPLPEGTRIVLRAKADAWLQVRDRQGPVLLNRVLRAGETWPVPPGKQPGQLLLTTGNAGGTEVLVDGQLTVGLGNDGAVRHDLPLDPDAIRNGTLAPPVVASRTAPPKR